MRKRGKGNAKEDEEIGEGRVEVTEKEAKER